MIKTPKTADDFMEGFSDVVDELMSTFNEVDLNL